MQTVSIIIPCFNDPFYVEQAIKSANIQTYPSKEIIVVDDGSNQETKTIINKNIDFIDILISQENKGTSAARNVGISEASGEIILVLDSDDYFEKEFCERAMPILEKIKDIKLITCYTRRFIGDKTIDIFKPKGGDVSEFIFGNQSLGSSLFRKIDWIKCGRYDEEMLTGFEDWEFYIRLLEHGGVAHVIPEVFFNYRLNKNSRTTEANKLKYKLLNYIYIKHKDLFVKHYDKFILHLLERIEREEREKLKNLKRIEYKLGHRILQPFRFFRKIFK